MNSKLDTLIQNATLDIMEFDIHKYPPRTNLNVIGRTTSYYIMSYIKQIVISITMAKKIQVIMEYMPLLIFII